MNNDAGWNGSGGPWIKPEQSMQKVVWSETDVEGPKRFEGALPQPEAVAGYLPRHRRAGVSHAGRLTASTTSRARPRYERRRRRRRQRDGSSPPEMVIDRDRIVDLTAQMDKDGRLAWDVPAGKWTVLRFGHTSTGVTNAPGARRAGAAWSATS